MERKKPATKFKSLLVLLAAVFAVFVSAVFTTQVAAQPNPYAFAGYEQSSGDEYERGGYTLEQIRELLQQGDTSGYKRIYNQYTGPAMYQMSAAETMEVFGPPGIQQFNNFTYNVRAVHGAGRPCNESIVLVLLGDGFTAGNGHGNVGYWPNPGVGTFLDFAVEFAYTITNMHPFSLFSDYFKIYAVETPSTQGIRAGVQGSPIDAPYPGTYLGSFFTEPGSFGIRVNRSAHALNISRWASSNAIMTQMILNSTEFGGVAFGAGAGYGNVNTLGVTSRWVGSGPASVGGGWTRPAYHSIVVHEIGHNFGRLMDEHSDLNVSAWHMGRANIALASDTDAQLKWRHWLGHAGITRRTTDAPVGFMFPSPAVPSGTTGDCKMRGWRANFCAVCSAELTRRMALISGDLFEAGLGPDGSSRPVTPTVTVAPQHTRILPYAFHGNTSLTTITIPASVTEIGNFAFIGATGLTEIVNHSTTPQQINYTTFAGVYRPGVDLHVPPGMAQAYISAGWAGFNFIDGGSLFTGITANPANLPRIGGNSTITAVGIGLNPSDMRIAAFHNNAGSPLYIQSPTGTADSVSANIAFPANADLNSRQYTVRVSMDGGTTWQIYPVATITIAPFPGIILTPDSATATASVGAGVDGRVLIELWNTSSSTMEVTLEGRFTGLYGTNTSFVPALYNMAGSLIAHRNLDQPGWTPANLGFTYGAITLAAGEGWLGFIGTGGNVASGIPLASIWVTSAVTFGLNPTSVTLTDANAQTVDATGTATGAITFGALSPANANISLTDAGGAVDVAFTGAMPNAGSPDAITGTHTVTVTREGESETLTIILDIPAYIPATTFGLNPISVTLSDANAQTVDATGNATGAITFGALSPANANISLTDAGGAVDVAFTGAMPNAGSPNAITGTHTVSVTREGESETLTIILDIPAYIPTTFPVTVSGSHAGVTGAGNYAIGITVTVNAGTREGFNFAGWTASPSVEFADASNVTTTFIMPGYAVTVTANWTPVPVPVPLPAPVGLSITGTTLNWDAVANASGYRVYVDGQGVGAVVTAVSFDLADLELAAGTHSVQVRAIGDVTNFTDSALSAPVDFIVVDIECREDLRAALTHVRELNHGDFTRLSWMLLHQVYVPAAALYNNQHATAQQLEAMTTRLWDAIDNLILIAPPPPPEVDKAPLIAAIEIAETFVVSEFTRLNWVLLQDALNHARAVANNENATQVQVDAALNRLDTAKSNRLT